MSKIKLNSIISTNGENTIFSNKAILKDNSVKYSENNTMVKIKFFDDKLILERENEDYKFEILFKEKLIYESKYFLKKLNTYIMMKVNTTKLEKKNKKYIIEYELFMSDESNGLFRYELEWSDL